MLPGRILRNHSESLLNRRTCQLAQSVSSCPFRRSRVKLLNRFASSYGGPVESHVPLPDLPQCPVHSLLYEISITRRFSNNNREKFLKRPVNFFLTMNRKVSHQYEDGPLPIFLRPPRPFVS